MRRSGEFRLRVTRAGRLERNSAAENSPVDLRQRDMHRQIRRPQPALRRAPGVEAHAREHDLHDWRVERIKDGTLALVPARGEGRGVKHDIEAALIEKGAQRLKRRFVLKTG